MCNLTRTGNAVAGNSLILASDISVSGVMTLTGDSAANILTFSSSSYGTRRTVTVDGSISVSHVRFMGIGIAGDASPLYVDSTCNDAVNNDNVYFYKSRMES